jgi:hypothetical protein
MLRKLKWQILAARYDWCQGPGPGRGPAVEKHWFIRLFVLNIACPSEDTRRTSGIWSRVHWTTGSSRRNMDCCVVSVRQTVALPGLLFASHRHFSGVTVVYQPSVRLRQVDTLIICVTVLCLLILIIRSCLFRSMSDNGYVLPESELRLPNRGAQLERPLLHSAVHGFWPVE